MPAIERCNVIFCLFDSLSAADSNLFEDAATLPTLSHLRDSSALFTHVYTPCPESSPARASLFTGLDPCVHGLWTNGVSLPDTERTFAQQLAQAGYSTYLAGRYQLAGVSRWTTEQIRHGEYAQVDWAHGPLHRSRQNAYLAWLQKAAPGNYDRIFPTQADPDNNQATQQQRDAVESLADEFCFNHWVGEKVCDWIAQLPPAKPFLAMAGFSVGGGLGAQPNPDSDGESLNVSALQQADAAIGKILKQLKTLDYAQDTVVIVASARGNAIDGDTVMSEQHLRVPLLIHRTGQKQQVVEAPVSTIDIAPTVLSLANVSIGPRMQGESLLGALDGSNLPKGWAMSRLRRSPTSSGRHWQTALCSNDMKLVVSHGDDAHAKQKVSLYNLDTDPLEQNNLAESAEHAIELENMIDQMIDARCALEDRTEPRIAEF